MEKNRKLINRGLIYAFGVIILAVGLTLNTKTGLGASSVVAVPFALSQLIGLRMSVVLFFFYALLVLLQFLIRGKDRRWRDLLQLPFSFVFSALMDVVERVLVIELEPLWQNLLLTLLAVLLMAAGIWLMVCMNVIVNPADGMTQAMSWKSKKPLGLMKNLLDLICVCTALVIDLIHGSLWSSVGLGTVITVILTGRVIALLDNLFRERVLRAAGLAAETEA